MKDVVVVILAGGKSDRFWPLNNKNLLDFSYGNLLEHHINTLSKLGVKDFIVVCSAEVAAFLRVSSGRFPNIKIERVLQNSNKHGIGNAVLLAFPVYSNKYKGRPVYIINCNDIYESSIHEKIYSKLKQESCDAVVGAYTVTKHMPLGYFTMENSRVAGIIEKPEEKNRPSDQANMALHLYKSFNLIADSIAVQNSKKDENDDLYERALNAICQKNKVLSVSYSGDWEILKFSWNTLSVMNYLLKRIENKISDKAIIDKSAKITGPVVIEEGVKILEYCRIVGPAVIKKNSIIGTGTLVRESIIGRGCIVGYSTEITRSYVGNDCWFHTNYIGDSVLGNNVTMGAGSVLANLRLNQKTIHSKVKGAKIDSQRSKLGAIIGNSTSIGVQSAIMPGVKIGKNSVIGPMVLLVDDIPDASLAFVKQKLEVTSINSSIDDSSRKQFRKLLNKEV